MLWSISGTSHQILGSIHVVPQRTAMPFWVDAALRGKRCVVFEADHTDRSIAEIGIDREGRHLADPAVAAIYARAAELLGSFGRNEPFDALRPWRAAFHVAFALLGRGAIFPGTGADFILRSRAESIGLEIGYLEDARRVFDIFESCEEPNACERFFDYTVTHHERALTEFLAIFRAWLAGDLTSLEDIAEEKRRLFPAIYETLIFGRNTEWTDIAVRFVARETPTLFVVGALHLAGERGFLACLRNRGFTIVPA